VTVTEVATTPQSGPRLGLAARLVGVLLSPRETYADVAARPRVLGALLVTLVISTGATFWFQSTPTGQKAVIAQAERTLDLVESLGGRVPDEAYDNLETAAARAPYQSAASIAVITPLLMLIMAGIYLGVFNGIMGGNARFKQVFAILAHAGFISGLSIAFNALMGFVRGEATGATSLSVFFPMLPESGFVTYFLGFIDLFALWAVLSTAIGLAVLYRRRTGPIATSLYAIYLCVGVVYALVRSLFAGA
jgi:hypothetical protein